MDGTKALSGMIASVALVLAIALTIPFVLPNPSDEPMVTDRMRQALTEPNAEVPEEDPYEGWTEIQSGGVVALLIPPGCTGDPGAGSIYIVCPTEENPTPTPEMVISSDGISVFVKRWEDLESPYWDRVIASLRVITPLDRGIEIHIEK